MFVLATWEPEGTDLQGIGVAAGVSGTWYLVPYEIASTLDPAQWIIHNAAQIETDALSIGQQIAAEDTVRELLNEGRSSDALGMMDDVDDIASIHEHPAFKRLIKALTLVIMDEINVLRNFAGLTPRTVAQLRTALRNKYKSLL